MSGTDPFSDSWYSMEFGQTNPFPGQDLVPTVPSQMAASRWYPPPLARRGPATPLPDVADTGFPPPGKNTPFDFHHRGGPPFCLEGSPPFVFHSRFHPEGISLPHTIDPRTLLSSTMSVINGPTVERSQAHISETPPIQDSPANGSANAAKSVRFLRMRSKHRYECSWDDGSGKICGYSGTLLEAKRHVQRVHPSNRCVFHWSTSITWWSAETGSQVGHVLGLQ